MLSDNWQARATAVLAGGPGTFSKHWTRYPEGVGPVALVSGAGAYATDTEGRRWLDTVAALGPVLLGHLHPAVTQAVIHQLGRGTSFSLMHPLEVEVADQLCEVLPCADMVRWCRNGTDATHMALRLARAVTGNRHVIFAGYHGGAGDSYGITTDKAAGILPQLAPYNHQTTWDDLANVPRHAYEDLAAIMVEVPSLPWGTAPQQIEEALQRYKGLTQRHGAVFILDEIVTWPRYGITGAQGLYNVMPDLCTISKAIANGLPLAALVGQKAYMERLNRGDIFASYTFAGETTALAAAQAVIATLRETDALANLQHQGQVLGDGIQRLLQEYDMPAQLLGNYARMAVRWQDVPGIASTLQLRTLFLAEMARDRILWGTGVCFPMACWTAREVEKILEAVEHACGRIGHVLVTQRINEALPCPVIQDVIAVRA